MKFELNNAGYVQGVSNQGDLYPRRYNVVRIARNSGGSYFLNCCGLVGLENFGVLPEDTYKCKAAFMALLYKELYVTGTVMYALADHQLTNKVHSLLLEIGAKEVAVFPNLAHGTQMIHVFVVKIRNAAGRFCNKYGEAYAEPPKDDSEIIPEQTDPTPTGWVQFPTR